MPPKQTLRSEDKASFASRNPRRPNLVEFPKTPDRAKALPIIRSASNRGAIGTGFAPSEPPSARGGDYEGVPEGGPGPHSGPPYQSHRKFQ